MLDVSSEREPERLVRNVVEGLPRLFTSEITTLSICDLAAGTRRVMGFPHGAICAADQECFNGLLRGHPLVRYHSTHPGAGACRISDCVSPRAFRRQEIFAEYYRGIGIDYVMAVPVIASRELVMSYVLNRKGLDFTDGERNLLDAPRARQPLPFRDDRRGVARGAGLGRCCRRPHAAAARGVALGWPRARATCRWPLSSARACARCRSTSRTRT